ncbi:MAG: hypothetical protein J6U92_05865, partial [Clostridia bacterium]|nr:hypothetical protein [Clostridia bacterium]
ARIQGVRAIESKKQISFKKGNSAIARFNFRGKTLCCLLGLEPVEYEDSKYIFTDVSDVKAHERYPMRVKLTSNRQTRWTEELLGDLVAKKGCVLLEKPIDIVSEVINAVNQEVAFTSFAERKDFRTFKEKLEDADDLIKDRYQKLTELVSRIKGIRVIESKKQVSFKKGSLPVARFNFRGKTLCCLLGLTPAEYEDTKYIFKDVSNVKAHERYPMRVKLTSNRQTRWTEELLLDLIAKKGLILLEKPRAIKSIFGGLKAEKKSFEEKLNRSNKQVKEWYAQVVDKIKSVAGIREIQSFGFRTFRFGNKPIAKITIKGKTLNVYLALNPKDYIDTKYIYQDASTVKKYANYPMRVKLTSNRKVKWTAELLDDVFSGVKL